MKNALVVELLSFSEGRADTVTALRDLAKR